MGSQHAAKIDVAVPCYQYARYLRDCVSSITSQPVDGLRILVIDNGSTDGSADVARSLAAGDSRIELKLCDVNRGPNFSYNAAVDWAAAEYFIIVDADDVLAPGCLPRALAVLDANPSVVFCHGLEARLMPSGQVCIDRGSDTDKTGWRITAGGDFIAGLVQTPTNRVGAPTVVRRTSAQKRVGGYRPELPFTDDLEMWLRLATLGSVAATSETQAVRRIHAGQMTNQFKSAEAQVRDFFEREKAFESFFAHEGCSIPDRYGAMRRVRHGLAEHAYWSALSHACRGYPRTALELMKYTVSRHPRALVLPPIGWLRRMERPFGRMADVLKEALA